MGTGSRSLAVRVHPLVVLAWPRSNHWCCAALAAAFASIIRVTSSETHT